MGEIPPDGFARMPDFKITGPVTIFIAPVGTPFPDTPSFDPGDEWELLHPTCPDAPPPDLAEPR